MKDASNILNAAGVPVENQLILIRDLWDLMKSLDPSLDENFVLIIWPSRGNTLEIDLLPRPVLNPLPKNRLPDKK